MIPDSIKKVAEEIMDAIDDMEGLGASTYDILQEKVEHILIKRGAIFRDSNEAFWEALGPTPDPIPEFNIPDLTGKFPSDFGFDDRKVEDPE